MTVFDVLLEVQEHDTAGDRLRHRRAALPERAELSAVESGIDALDQSLADVAARREALDGEQGGLEAKLETVDARIAEIDRRLYSGEVSATRELLAMSDEIESLKRRRSSLEDDVLAAMEAGEPLAAEAAALERQRAELAARADALRRSIGEAEAAIDAELAAEERARAEAAAGLPADLLERYERLRSKLGGVGAARLVGPSCQGCHLTLPATEIARIKRESPDALVLCDQCGRILVR